jgi:hypothetical protein
LFGAIVERQTYEAFVDSGFFGDEHDGCHSIILDECCTLPETRFDGDVIVGALAALE